MVYIFAVIGFIAGFTLGLYVLGRLLAGKPRAELMRNKSLWYSYGTLCWIIALSGAALGVVASRMIFP